MAIIDLVRGSPLEVRDCEDNKPIPDGAREFVTTVNYEGVIVTVRRLLGNVTCTAKVGEDIVTGMFEDVAAYIDEQQKGALLW